MGRELEMMMVGNFLVDRRVCRDGWASGVWRRVAEGSEVCATMLPGVALQSLGIGIPISVHD